MRMTGPSQDRLIVSGAVLHFTAFFAAREADQRRSRRRVSANNIALQGTFVRNVLCAERAMPYHGPKAAETQG